MPKKASPERFLNELDSTVLAIPLLEKMKGARANTSFDVMIEVNLMHQSEAPRTKDQIIRMVEERGGTVRKALGVDTEQYVFARLTKSQIRLLAQDNETKRRPAREGAGQRLQETATRSLRPIFKIWPDFEVELLLTESLATVKADAAHVAFSAAGRGVVWAVIDSGIDGTHSHFKKHRNLHLEAPLAHYDFSGDEPVRIESPEEVKDPNGHGTHVAGIIAGEVDPDEKNPRALVRSRDEQNQEYREARPVPRIRGVAPECRLLSLRVADERGRVNARNIIAALGYIRRINSDRLLPRIHGVNISLGYPFEAEWYGCGQSPLCAEVNRLERSGVIVVVAAGNGGYGRRQTDFKGEIRTSVEGSILDPANAERAITVGSTHRDRPHTYGVSYFSAKGPTGDGRRKPDLVAPGERIISCAAEARRQRMGADEQSCLYVEDSGTSMAAPHVSGCIAAFLSVRDEFKNQPERVKDIFLSTATDLGREPYYQGRGLVDLMRAIQSV